MVIYMYTQLQDPVHPDPFQASNPLFYPTLLSHVYVIIEKVM